MGRFWLMLGSIQAFLFVALGAFGAHALKAQITAEKMQVLHTANQYLAFHAVALLALGLWGHWEKWASTFFAGLCFSFGSLIFSGSLYVYVLAEWPAAAMFTPVGGSFFLLGWVLFTLSIFRTRNSIV